MNKDLLEQVSELAIQQLARGVLQTYQLQGLTGLREQAALATEIDDIHALKRTSEEVVIRKKDWGLGEDIPDANLHESVFDYPGVGKLLCGAYREDDDTSIVEMHCQHPPTADTLTSLAKHLQAQYAWHQPEYLVLWAPGNTQLDTHLNSLPGVIRGDGLYGATSDALALSLLPTPPLPTPKGGTGLTPEISPFDLDTDWAWYEEEYLSFLDERPELKDIVPISEREDLQQAIEAGLCVKATLAGKPLGMLMAEPSSLLGYKGILLTDLFVTRAYRGQGHAAQMQRAALRFLTPGYEFVSGFIHANNPASYRTALKQNRRLLRQEYYVPFAALTGDIA